MDKNTYKILKFLIKHKAENISIIELSKFFPELPKEYIIEIVNYLRKNDYVRYIGINTYIKITNKGEMFFNVSNNNWISEHFIEILDFVVAFIALIFSTIDLFLK